MTQSDADARPASLPGRIVAEAVKRALPEDLGDAGDITTAAVVDPQATSRATIRARKAGVVAGLDLVSTTFEILGGVEVTRRVADGEPVAADAALIQLRGSTRAILAGERVALNFLGHLSGIATLTRAFVTEVAGHPAQICCTRKTLPGLRALEKFAVRAGGGKNHRFGLYDGILIKDNHIEAAGGVTAALQAARRYAGHMVKIEIEIDDLNQLDEALAEGADMVLLDNMSPETLTDAVARVNGRALTEASGGVNLQTVRAIAASGVDLISVGALTHSAPWFDVGLDFDEGVSPVS